MSLLTRLRTRVQARLGTRIGALDGAGAAPHGGGGAVLRIPRRAALVAISVLVAAASLVSFAESYRALYDWAAGHGLAGPWAVIWPLQVDVFIAVGELALFVALADRWAPRSRAAAWAVTLAGLAVSVAGNVGHVASYALAARATAAVPPLAAASALAVGLGVLKRVVGHRPQAALAATPQAAQAAPQAAAPVVLHAAPSGVSRPSRSAIRKPSPSAVKRMSGSDLAPYAGTLLEATPGLTASDLMKTLKIGREKASEALRVARRDRLRLATEG